MTKKKVLMLVPVVILVLVLGLIFIPKLMGNNNEFIGEWISHDRIDYKTQQVLSDTSFGMIIRKNGTFSAHTNKKSYEGKWEYDKKEKEIKLIDANGNGRSIDVSHTMKEENVLVMTPALESFICSRVK